ncbi:MAG: DUF1835 domain-containing protein [Flavobacteriaceae bacterium]|nr:DUF1835 domain-containing protein [Flavobacteriaceae bacterium]
MNRTLHILNGDSTAESFAKSSLQGDVLIWREMLCEGALHKNIGSDTFWKRRYDFFENELGIEKIEYFDKTIKEIIKLDDLSKYSEVVLWFEYDLFCQINLLGACTYLLKSFRKDIRYYLICTGKEKGKQQLQSLTDYHPNHYQTLFDNKIKLSRNNLLFAETCWNLYVENDADKLKSFDFKGHPKFEYLPMAIEQHLQRFPGKNGLNQIETKILEIIDAGISDKKDIVKALLFWQAKETVYGFGDQQYSLILDQLKAYYIDKNGVILLNDKAKELIG